MTCCQVSDRCPLGYLFVIFAVCKSEHLNLLSKYIGKYYSYELETWSTDRVNDEKKWRKNVVFIFFSYCTLQSVTLNFIPKVLV